MASSQPKSPYIVTETQALRNFQRSGSSMMDKKQREAILGSQSVMARASRKVHKTKKRRKQRK